MTLESGTSMGIEPVRVWTLRDKITKEYIHQIKGRGAIPGHIDVWMVRDILWQIVPKYKKWEIVAGMADLSHAVRAKRGYILPYTIPAEDFRPDQEVTT